MLTFILCCKLTSIPFPLVLCVFPNPNSWLLESAISLEKLDVSQCDGITFFKIPSHLEQLSALRIFRCRNLQMIEIYAPKVSTFSFTGPPTKIPIINSSQSLSCAGKFLLVGKYAYFSELVTKTSISGQIVVFAIFSAILILLFS